jgi:hypothetical protein
VIHHPDGQQRARHDGLWHSAETQNGCQGFVDTPLLFGRDMADQIAKPSSVDGADLLDQDTGNVSEQVNLGAE